MVCWNRPTLSTLAPRGNHKGGSYLVASSRWEHSGLSSVSTVGTETWSCSGMSSEHDSTRQEEPATLRRLETFAFFLAMMLAVILDGACACWMWKHVGPVSTNMVDPLCEQKGSVLREGWLLAALLVLICRTVETLCTVKSWSHGEVLQNQRAFLCLWGWAIALLIALGVAIHLGPVAP